MRLKKAAAATLTLLVIAVTLCTLLPTIPLPLREGNTPSTSYTLSSTLCKYSVDPEISLSSYWINYSWFNTSRPVTLTLEENFTGNEYLHINCSSSFNQSVAMSFNISSLGGIKVNFTGVSLYIWKNGTDNIDLVVQLRNATSHDSLPVPNVTIFEYVYSSSDIPSSPGWVTLLNKTPITLNLSDTYEGYFFIVVYTNVTSETTCFVWNATADDDANSGHAFTNNFISEDDLNNVSMWSPVSYDCWMNVSLVVYEGFEFSLPVGWDLDYLFLDIFDDVVFGSVSGEVDGLNGSFSVPVPGDRVYSAAFSFSGVVPGSVWVVLEDRMNSGGYARIAGGMGEAQMFLLRRSVSGISISVPVANFGMTADLTAELRSATFNVNRWVPGDDVIESVDVSSSAISPSYSWVTLNFTSNLSAGAYFLVLHVKDWLSSPDGGYYDWGSHMEGETEGPPEGGYEIWTTDGGNSWVEDVRDPYGNRYWHCMKIAPNYTDWRILNDLLLAANGLLVCNDGSWNSSMWLTLSNGNISVYVTAATQINYNVTYTISYVNYTGNLSAYELYLNGTKITSFKGGYTKYYTGSEIGYNKSDGKLSFLAELKSGGDWVSENLTVFALAKLTFRGSVPLTGAEVTYDYTHSGSTVFPEQQFITLYYPANYAVKNVSLNDFLWENWLDSALNETTRKLTILRNNSFSLLEDESTFSLNVSLLPELNVSHGFGYINEPLTITVGNLLDNPEKVNATIIFPNGSIQVSQFTPQDGSFNVTFTPNVAGKYALRVVSLDGEKAYDRNFTSGCVYVFHVHKLAAFFVQSRERWVAGETYTVMVWVGYTPPSGRSFSGNVSVTVNGTQLQMQYDQEAGLYVARFRPESVGVLNLTVNAEDEEGHSVSASILVNVSYPEGVKPLSLLTATVMQATLKYWEFSQLNNKVSFFFLLATLAFVAVLYLKPEAIEKMLNAIRRLKKVS